MANSRRPAKSSTPPALRIARSVGRGIAVFVLSLFYYATSGVLVSFGVACVWNGLGPGDSRELDHPVVGIVLLALGLVVFLFFPRLVKKLTGRDVISTPYGGF